MSFNLVDLIKDQLGGQILNQIGGALGGSPDVTQKAVGGVVPALLQGLASSGGNVGGADALFKAVQDQDDGILSNIGDLIGGGGDSAFAGAGTNVLGSLLGGGALGNLAGAISGFSGLGRGASGSLMGMVAPIILSVIKRKVLGGGLNASGLMDMLSGQKDNISGAMPDGLSDQLQKSGFLDGIGGTLKGGASAVTDTAGAAADAVGNAASSVGGAAADTAKAGGGMLGKLVPLILLGALAFFGLKMCSQPESTVVETIEPEAVEVERTEQVVVESEAAVTSEAEVVESAATGAATGVSGTYDVTQSIPILGDVSVTLNIAEDGTGSVNTPIIGAVPFGGIDINGNSFKFTTVAKTPMGEVPVTWDGIVEGDTITGSISGLPAGVAPFTGTRQ